MWTLRGVCKESTGALAEVEAAEVSHEKGTAVVTLRSEVSDEVLKKAVEEKDMAGYYKTHFEICFLSEGEVMSYTGARILVTGKEICWIM